MTLRIQRLSSPFGALSYREVGEAHRDKNQTIILIHGVGMQSAVWMPQFTALSDTYHMLAFDMPGHGETSPLPSDSKLETFVEWLGATIDVFKLGRVNLVGHSMGALVVSGFAIINSCQVERVALLNGVFCRNEDARSAVIRRAEMVKSGSFDLETPLSRWFGNGQNGSEARKHVSGWLSEVSLEGYATAYNAFARGDATYADRFDEISCPFMALTGELDPNSTPSMSRAMANAVPNGQAIIIAGHKHMVNLTAPDMTNSALAHWLQTSVG